MERLYIVNPYDETHKELLMNFERENSITTRSLGYSEKITSSQTEEEYINNKRVSNEVEIGLFLEENNKIKDLCFIQGEKDISTCKMYFTNARPKSKTRKLLNLATDFALNTLGMKEVFIISSSNDKSMQQDLERKGFENLGSEGDSIIYLIEKTDEKINQMHQ